MEVGIKVPIVDDVIYLYVVKVEKDIFLFKVTTSINVMIQV